MHQIELYITVIEMPGKRNIVKVFLKSHTTLYSESKPLTVCSLSSDIWSLSGGCEPDTVSTQLSCFSFILQVHSSDFLFILQVHSSDFLFILQIHSSDFLFIPRFTALISPLWCIYTSFFLYYFLTIFATIYGSRMGCVPFFCDFSTKTHVVLNYFLNHCDCDQK